MIRRHSVPILIEAGHLTPGHPAEALALAESVVQGDEVILNRADDLIGVVGDAVRAACVL